MATENIHSTFRKYHRWLGFFLAGIMAVYAISGVLLIFRKTEFLKFEYVEATQLETGLDAAALLKTLNTKGLEVISESASLVALNRGEYDKASGIASMTSKGYPPVLAKMVKLHKATHKSPLYWLNITFGTALLFFVVSAFFMFMPKIPMFKSSMKIAGLGVAFALLVVIFGS